MAEVAQRSRPTDTIDIDNVGDALDFATLVCWIWISKQRCSSFSIRRTLLEKELVETNC